MKILLFLNGINGCQTGIEDGFISLHAKKIISEFRFIYYEEIYKSNNFNIKTSCDELFKHAKNFLPNIIIFFHIGKYKLTDNFLFNLKDISSSPILVYDEGDMYGSLAKPMTSSMKLLMSHADSVSIRGLGSFEHQVKKIAKNVFYTPHHNDVARFMKSPFFIPKTKKNIILIGNRVKSKILGNLIRLPGARDRETFVKYMYKNYPENFIVYGNGWKDICSNSFPIDFYDQNEYYRNALVTVAYEHYPNIPFYFSNRLPIALMNGSLYVCHEHEGYRDIFPEGDFIFFFKNSKEASENINFILSMDENEIYNRSLRAHEFALLNYHPSIVWRKFLDNVIHIGKNN